MSTLTAVALTPSVVNNAILALLVIQASGFAANAADEPISVNAAKATAAYVNFLLMFLLSLVSIMVVNARSGLTKV